MIPLPARSKTYNNLYFLRVSNRGESVLVCINFTYDDAVIKKNSENSDNVSGYPVDLQPSNVDTHRTAEGHLVVKSLPLVWLPLYLLFAATEVTVKKCHERTYDAMYNAREVQQTTKT